MSELYFTGNNFGCWRSCWWATGVLLDQKLVRAWWWGVHVLLQGTEWILLMNFIVGRLYTMITYAPSLAQPSFSCSTPLNSLPRWIATNIRFLFPKSFSLQTMVFMHGLNLGVYSYMARHNFLYKTCIHQSLPCTLMYPRTGSCMQYVKTEAMHMHCVLQYIHAWLNRKATEAMESIYGNLKCMSMVSSHASPVHNYTETGLLRVHIFPLNACNVQELPTPVT